MKNARYTTEFKAAAIKQVAERGHGVVDVSKRSGGIRALSFSVMVN